MKIRVRHPKCKECAPKPIQSMNWQLYEDFQQLHWKATSSNSCCAKVHLKRLCMNLLIAQCEYRDSISWNCCQCQSCSYIFRCKRRFKTKHAVSAVERPLFHASSVVKTLHWHLQSLLLALATPAFAVRRGMLAFATPVCLMKLTSFSSTIYETASRNCLLPRTFQGIKPYTVWSFESQWDLLTFSSQRCKAAGSNAHSRNKKTEKKHFTYTNSSTALLLHQ